MQVEAQKLVVTIENYDITIRRTKGQADFISLTDFAKQESEDPNAVIQNWMRSRSTVEYLGIWEDLYNPDFNKIEATKLLVLAGKNSFTLSPKKWIEATNAIGLQSKAGRYGGTYAHEDIALEFMSWVSAKFKLYFMKEYKRLKIDENERLYGADPENVLYLPGSNNTAIFTGLPPRVQWHDSYESLSAEDILNVAMFGMTQTEFDKKYRMARGTVHNNSSVDHILIYDSLRHKNADLVHANVEVKKRLFMLNEAAISMLSSRFGAAVPALPLPEQEDGDTAAEQNSTEQELAGNTGT